MRLRSGQSALHSNARLERYLRKEVIHFGVCSGFAFAYFCQPIGLGKTKVGRCNQAHPGCKPCGAASIVQCLSRPDLTAAESSRLCPITLTDWRDPASCVTYHVEEGCLSFVRVRINGAAARFVRYCGVSCQIRTPGPQRRSSRLGSS
jgi:hypothetical protein